MRLFAIGMIIVATCAMLIGCGETVSGVGKDATRMGKGLNTFFFRQ